MLRRLAVAVSLLSVAFSAPALAWPDKPLRIIVGFAAGGGSDRIARYYAEALRHQFNESQIIIDNRPGETGGLAVDALKAATDNHTVMVYPDEFLTVPLVNKAARYRTLRDLKPVTLLGESTAVLVVGSKAPFGTFESFAQYARANPGKVTYATSGKGSKFNLVGELVSHALKLGMTHVNTRGQGMTVNDLVDGQLHMAILGLPPIMRGLRAGELTALAVAGSARDPRLPNTPTLEELGLRGFTTQARFGLVAPKSMPDDLVERLAEASARALADPKLRAQFEEAGIAAHPLTPKQYGDSIAQVIGIWEKLISDNSLTVD
jgi:tripartite-type tricarboxylate transporter receptor subunit TctC